MPKTRQKTNANYEKRFQREQCTPSVRGSQDGRKLEGRKENRETEVLYIKVKISRLYLKRTFPLNPKNKTKKARKPHHMYTKEGLDHPVLLPHPETKWGKQEHVKYSYYKGKHLTPEHNTVTTFSFIDIRSCIFSVLGTPQWTTFKMVKKKNMLIRRNR